jgi:DNA-binding NtrC family response regulator
VRLQVALLRVLESGEIRPVGSARDRKVACRIVAATNADLDTMVAAQRFRQDLLYRLRRLELPIPPLRARAEDILPLAESFLNEGRAGAGRAKISAELGGELRRRDWPGNVRELRNTIERMRLLNSDKLAYDVADLNTAEREVAPRVPASAAQAGPASPVPGGPQSGGVAAAELAVLDSERTMMRQLERLRGLFARHGRLTRKEITRILDVAPATAAKYLKTLRADGTIDKVTPSASPRSHYFRLRG